MCVYILLHGCLFYCVWIEVSVSFGEYGWISVHVIGSIIHANSVYGLQVCEIWMEVIVDVWRYVYVHNYLM